MNDAPHALASPLFESLAAISFDSVMVTEARDGP